MAVARFNWQGTINWFPGHMAKASRMLKDTVKGSDLVMEVRSANPHFEAAIGNKARIIVFNKSDLVEAPLLKRLDAHYAKQNQLIFFTSSKAKQRDFPRIVPRTLEWLRLRRNVTELKGSIQMAVVGYPNVGKSTIINSLREVCMKGKKVAKTGPMPGVTRAISGFRVSENPPAYLLDSPGIMVPKVDDNEVGFKLSVIYAIKDSVLGPTLIGEFLWWSLSRAPYPVPYVSALGLASQPTSYDDLLRLLAVRLRYTGDLTSRREKSAIVFLKAFREGKLGKHMLDDIPAMTSAH